MDRTPAPHRARSRRTVVLTIGVVLLSAALVGAGAFALRLDADEGRPSGAAPAPAVVRLMPLESADHATVPRRFVGRVEAAQAQALAFERPGTLVEVAVDEGDEVERGAALARLDTRALEARLDEARAGRRALAAQAELAALTARRRGALEARGFSPAQAADEARLEVEGARARIAEADAAIEGLSVDLGLSVLRAPYDGRIGRRHADPGAVLGAGEPVLSLLEDASPRMRVGLPPEIAAGLAAGDTVDARIGGELVPATVLRVRPDLDPATLTQALVLELGAEVVAGRAGTVELSQEIEARGAWVPLAALREGERGLWTVLAARPNNDVLRAVAVEILVVDGARAFVAGAFEPDTRIVAEGAHRVAPGQAVVAAEE